MVLWPFVSSGSRLKDGCSNLPICLVVVGRIVRTEESETEFTELVWSSSQEGKIRSERPSAHMMGRTGALSLVLRVVSEHLNNARHRTHRTLLNSPNDYVLIKY